MGKAGQSCFSHFFFVVLNCFMPLQAVLSESSINSGHPPEPCKYSVFCVLTFLPSNLPAVFFHKCTLAHIFCVGAFSGNGPAFAWVHLRWIDTVRVLRQLCHLVSSPTLIPGRKGKLIHRSVGLHPHGCTICRNYSNCIQGATKVSGTDYSL